MGFFKKKQVSSFDILLLRESGMRFTREYEIKNEGGSCVITLYDIYYEKNETARRVLKTARCDEGAVIELLNGCDILKWNGFRGAHPKNVHDGIMFTFTAAVNGGEKTEASGSENFPENYRKFKEGLIGFLAAE